MLSRDPLDGHVQVRKGAPDRNVSPDAANDGPAPDLGL